MTPEITIATLSLFIFGIAYAETLRLCDACYAEFVAMEAAYA